MQTLDLIARTVIGALLAAVTLIAMEHWNDEQMRAKGCIVVGTPGSATQLTKDVSVVGRVWFCKEKTP